MFTCQQDQLFDPINRFFQSHLKYMGSLRIIATFERFGSPTVIKQKQECIRTENDKDCKSCQCVYAYLKKNDRYILNKTRDTQIIYHS